MGITTPKCTLTYEEIETQNCVPKVENVCDTVDVEQESITFEKECKDVTSKVCGPAAGAIPIIKREAEADPWLGLAGHAIGAPYVHHAPALAPAALAHGYATIKSDCREVTKEVCVNTPKQNCEAVETEVPVAPALPALPAAGLYGAGHGL